MIKAKITQIETQRLILRGFEPNDTNAYWKILGDPEVAQWLGKPEGFSKDDARNWIHGFVFWWERHGYAPWAVIEKESNELIGHCGLKFAETFKEVELLYAIRADKWGMGYGVEAAGASVQFAFEQMGLTSLIAYTLKDNIYSQKVIKNLGFVFQKNITHAQAPHLFYRLQHEIVT